MILWQSTIVTGARKRGRQSGRARWAVAVLISAAAVAALVASISGLLVPFSAAATILASGAAIAALYPILNAGTDNRLDVTDAANQLAAAVDKQWRKEVAKRRLGDPYPLDIRWDGVTVSWTADWDSLELLAQKGPGWPMPQGSGWTAGPETLAGGDRQLREVIGLVPTGRLLVLGAPGAGKTMLMVRLVLDLLKNREDTDPVPVLVSLASWNPAEQDLGEWLADSLARDHPALASPTPPISGETTQAELLVATGLVMPILDGLDEIPRTLRGLAIQHINTWNAGVQLVVTCRIGEQANDIWQWEPESGISGPLLQAAAVKLRPLEAKEVALYLAHGTSSSSSRWRPVTDVLGTSAPASMALTTPLMVAMARSVYTPRPDENSTFDSEAGLPDPAELINFALDTRSAVEHRLLDQFIATAYYQDPDPRWPPEKAELWLTFIASHLTRTIGSPDLAWWQLWRATPPFVFAIAAGIWTAVATGIAAGLGHGVGRGIAAGLVVGLAAAPFGGLAGGLAVGFAVARWRRANSPESTNESLRIRGLAAGAAVGLAAMTAVGIAFGLASGLSNGLLAGLKAGTVPGLGSGLVWGLAVGLAAVKWPLPQPSLGMRRRARPRRSLTQRVHIRVGTLAAALVTGTGAALTVSQPYGPGYGILVGLATGLAVSLAYGLQRRPSLNAAATPQRALTRERRAAIAFALPAVVGVGLIFAPGFPLVFGLIVGLTSGLAVGNIISILKTAWPTYRVSHAWLALHGELPWQFMGFLQDAHERGVLRQEGTLYQFRHHDLQERLASRTTPKSSTPQPRHRFRSTHNPRKRTPPPA